MASNPMQKKSRNAFLLGMLLMLIVAIIAMILMFVLLKKDNKKQEQQQASQTYVYRLNTSVKSGEEITKSKVTSVLVSSEAVPAGAAASKSKTTTKDGKDSWIDKSFIYDGYKSKIDLPEGTIICDTMLYEGEELQASERIQEYNMLQLPVQLEPGEYVDVRFQISNGQDYIVVSHKEVIDVDEKTIWLQMKEEEILLLSNAMVESYISPATNLYVTKYVEPGTQGAATVTYIPSEEVMILVQKDPNVVETANRELTNRYLAQKDTLRNNIVTEISKYAEEGISNIQSNMLEAREKALEARQNYLYGIN